MSDQQNLSRPTGADISSPFGPVRPPLAELPPPYDFQSDVYDAVASDAVVRPPGPTTALGRAIAAEAATRRPPTPAYAADNATVRTAVHTTAQTLTAQSLLLLSRQPASPQSSSHSSVHHWLESTENMAPPPSPAESTLSSDRSEPQPQALRLVQMLRRSPRALLLRHALLRALPATHDAAPLPPLPLKFWDTPGRCPAI